MKKELKTKQGIFPMPVLMIGTYNEDGTVDVMNAAWGMMQRMNKVALKLTENHKTVENIKRTKAFTVGIPDASHVKEADYFGIVSANNEPKKFKKSGLSYTESELVDAPIINEFPICLECELIEYQGDENGCGVIGKVIKVSAEEAVMDDDQVNVDKLEAITYDPYTHGYYKVGGRVGNAYKEGLELK